MSNTDEKLNLIIANQEWIEYVLRSLSLKALKIDGVSGTSLMPESAANMMLKAADELRADKIKFLTQRDA